jgi:hypothetical protein
MEAHATGIQHRYDVVKQQLRLETDAPVVSSDARVRRTR